jgi:hypothetical protein
LYGKSLLLLGGDATSAETFVTKLLETNYYRVMENLRQISAAVPLVYRDDTGNSIEFLNGLRGGKVVNDTRSRSRAPILTRFGGQISPPSPSFPKAVAKAPLVLFAKNALGFLFRDTA